MKRFPLAILALITLTTALMSLASQLGSPVVNSVSNPTPQLAPGGPEVNIDLRGTNLDRIVSARVLSNGQLVSDVTVTLGAVAPTSRSVTLKALASAPVRTAMILRISDGRQTFDIPAKIIQIAVGPAQPINTLDPVDTRPGLIDTTKAPSTGPVVTSMAINRGAASTASIRVTLNMSVQNASYYRASENAAFTGASWQSWTITATPPFDLSSGNGTKTVYVQVKNPAGTVSPTVNDSITLNVPTPPARAEYKIDGSEAYGFSKSQGFRFSSKCEDPVTQEAYIDSNGLCKANGKPAAVFGARADFVLYDGRELNEGWVFKSYDAYTGVREPGQSYTVQERPTVGSRTIRFKIHLWCERGRAAEFSIKYLTIEGPAGRDWREAFR